MLFAYRTCVGRVIEGEVDMSDVSSCNACKTLHHIPHLAHTGYMTPSFDPQVADISFTLEEDELEQVSMLPLNLT